MDNILWTPDGNILHTLTLTELKERAKGGDIDAIREVVYQLGGFSALSLNQKDIILQLMLKLPVSL